MTRESSERSERDGPVPAVPSRPKARHSHYARRRRRAKPEGRRTEGRDRAAGLAVHDGRRKRAGPLRRGLRSGPIEGHGAGTRGSGRRTRPWRVSETKGGDKDTTTPPRVPRPPSSPSYLESNRKERREGNEGTGGSKQLLDHSLHSPLTLCLSRCTSSGSYLTGLGPPNETSVAR